MLLHIPGLFSREEVQRIREALMATEWADGKITAGYQSAKAKHNLQLPEGHPLAKEIGAAMIERLWQNPLFMSAALPHKVFPPLINCYPGGYSLQRREPRPHRCHLGGLCHLERNGQIRPHRGHGRYPECQQPVRQNLLHPLRLLCGRHLW